jgi:predicted secreted protein
MNDCRSKKLVLLCHCILNQNSKVEGIARYPGTFRPAVDLILQSDAGIYQLPCPEMAYLGISRWSAVKAQYSSPFFRRHCRTLAERIMDEIEDYVNRGYAVLAVIGMDGSPSCGVDFTQQALGEPWGGRIQAIPTRRYLAGSGTFMDMLRDRIREHGLQGIPFLGLPENEAVGTVEEALQKMKGMLRG